MKPEIKLMRAIFGHRTEDDDNDFHSAIQGISLEEAIHSVLIQLPIRSQEILEIRFGFRDGKAHTLQELAQIYNVTRERIRQVEAKALRMLRHPIHSRQLKAYIKKGEE